MSIRKIRRNEFIKVASIPIFNTFLPYNSISKYLNKNDFDKYGGWKKKKFYKTGFFRTHFDNNRWWFVTPEGNAFISFGINHYHEEWWAQNYNINYWLKKFNSKQFQDKHWNEGFRKFAFKDLKKLGINTIGMHTNSPSITDIPYKSKVPYLREYKPVKIDHYINPKPNAYTDIFSPSFEIYCDNYAKETASNYKNDKMLLGYCMADCPIITDYDINFYSGTSWIRTLRNLGSDSAGKKAYVEMMRQKYNLISKFNLVYQTNFKNWEYLLNSRNWRKNIQPSNEEEKNDNHEFMLKCVERYYSVTKKSLFKYDSNHLFFGDKLNGNTDSLEKVINLVAKYVDVIFYQNFGEYTNQKKLLDKFVGDVNLPFLNGDAGFGVSYEMMPAPWGPNYKSQKERAEMLLKCCENLFSRPEFIGWHICGIIDTWKTMPTKEKNQHQGLMTVKGKYYKEMEIVVKNISKNLYKICS